MKQKYIKDGLLKKASILTTGIVCTLSGISCATRHNVKSHKQPTLGISITLTAQNGKEKELADFLRSGAQVVKQTESETLQWFAVQEKLNTFRIIDFFANQEAVDKHFSGKVATTLKEKAPKLVQDGWKKGVVSHITKSQVIASVVRRNTSHKVTIGNYISLIAKDGQEENLANLLITGAEIVKETEPETLLWYALRLDRYNFVIFDVFANEKGRKAHFAGKVAAALKTKASELVRGGWDNGVVKNVVNMNILSETF